MTSWRSCGSSGKGLPLASKRLRTVIIVIPSANQSIDLGPSNNAAKTGNRIMVKSGTAGDFKRLPIPKPIKRINIPNGKRTNSSPKKGLSPLPPWKFK